MNQSLLLFSQFQTYSKEILWTTVMTLGIISATTFLFWAQPTKALLSASSKSKLSSTTTTTTATMMSNTDVTTVTILQAMDVFTNEELQTLSVCYNEERPRGKFLKDRHGYTHYYLITNTSNTTKSKGLIAISHGIGVSHHAFDDFANFLVEAGYDVVMYDFYGHGYSKYDHGQMFFNYDAEMFVDQFEDVLETAEKESGEKCIAIIGHSTGGLVCAAASNRWGTKDPNAKRVGAVPKVILAAPAFYAKKPFMARVADKIPTFLTSVMRNVPASRVIIGDSYMEAGKIAFGHDENTGKTIYAEEEQKKVDIDSVLFGKVKGKNKHPYLEGGILSLNCNFLRGDLLPSHQKIFLNVLNEKADTSLEILWIWGKLDKTVPYKENLEEVLKWENEFDQLKVKILDQIGHEMFYENSKKMSEVAIDFLEG